MSDGSFHIPRPDNEPVCQYEPGNPRRTSLQKTMDRMASEKIDIPLVIGGREIRTGRTRKVTMPHDHGHVLAEFHLAGPEEHKLATQAALKAQKDWERLSWNDRLSVFLKAAEMLRGPWRDILNGSTMLGQSKNCFQAEVDSACELIDFFKFNPHYYREMLETQPYSPEGVWNRMDYRPLEGFVAAITPFNFTAIGGNLPTCPAMAGNVAVWKPSDTQMLSAWYTMKLLEAAGLPPGVVNLVGADGPEFGQTVLTQPELAGVHFTGSTGTFQWIWKTVGENIARYRSYPRIVGETGGKDFIFAHPSSEWESLAVAIARGSFEYQGQKCSAASRVYVPKSIWPRVRERLAADLKSMKMGDVRDFGNFINAVIDERAFNKISGYIEGAKRSSDEKVVLGGKCDRSKGWFIEPTVIETTNPKAKTMCDEIFGPVVTVYPYDDNKWEEVLQTCEGTSAYALTGALFSQDRAVMARMTETVKHAAGNLYLNDKPTGAVVGQNPFGGGRASGTNDKAGAHFNVLRWVSPRSIKESFHAPRDYRYPFLG
ncbi:MAG TPA: L-glutamate gamma-semialdehyde dehydrogenase [Bdellovibrionota bacterium]|nr:L-glutamate gamma-semialdehyde dehydrogenase [Bdellovibrionota bacterium]